MYDPTEKLEDAVAVLTSRLYNNLSYNWRDSDSIAAYYASDAVGGCVVSNFRCDAVRQTSSPNNQASKGWRCDGCRWRGGLGASEHHR